MLFTKGAVRSICAISRVKSAWHTGREKVNEHQMKKRLTTLALVIALMTGSVAQLAVLLYRGARIFAVSSLSFAADIGSPEWREQPPEGSILKSQLIVDPGTTVRTSTVLQMWEVR